MANPLSAVLTVTVCFQNTPISAILRLQVLLLDLAFFREWYAGSTASERDPALITLSFFLRRVHVLRTVSVKYTSVCQSKLYGNETTIIVYQVGVRKWVYVRPVQVSHMYSQPSHYCALAYLHCMLPFHNFNTVECCAAQATLTLGDNSLNESFTIAPIHVIVVIGGGPNSEWILELQCKIQCNQTPPTVLLYSHIGL